MKFSTLASLAIILCFQSAYAFQNVCALKNTPLDVSKFSAENVADYQSKLEQECRLQEKFSEFRRRVEKNHVRIDQISGYQALRYVQRSFYSGALASDKPVEQIYQATAEIGKSDLNDPRRSTEVWRNFATGIKSLDKVKTQILEGKSFDLATLIKVHKGFYTESCELGQFTHIPNPGIIKHCGDRNAPLSPWWSFKSLEAAQKAKAVVDVTMAKYENMGLVPAPVAYNPNAHKVLFVDLDRLTIHSGHECENNKHLTTILDLINTMLDQARKNQHMVWKGQLMSPAELAYLAQQFYVHIHPFYEGNGRTSRFIQELILSLFDMPVGSSGDLMDDDVLTTPSEYYKLAIKANNDQLDSLSNCITGYTEQRYYIKRDYDRVAQSSFSYQCRLLPNLEKKPIDIDKNCYDPKVMNQSHQ